MNILQQRRQPCPVGMHSMALRLHYRLNSGLMSFNCGLILHFVFNHCCFQTYNFDEGQHLANQRQQICIRYEPGDWLYQNHFTIPTCSSQRNEAGMCRICYWHESNADFGTGGTSCDFTRSRNGRLSSTSHYLNQVPRLQRPRRARASRGTAVVT